MKKISISAAVAIIFALFLNSCKSPVKEETGSLKSGIILENMDTTVRPGDNFFNYVCGSWLKKTEIPADKSSYGLMHILNDKSKEDVKTIIEACATGNFKQGSDEQKIGDLYSSYMNTAARDSIGVKPLLPEFERIKAISSYNQLAAYFAYAGKIGNMAPLNVSVLSDFKYPSQYMALAWQGGIGLPDREYYLLEDASFKDIRSKYVLHIEKMLSLAGIAGSKAKAKEIMALETKLASEQMKKEESRNVTALYNKYAVSNLKTLMPDFDWATFMKEASLAKLDTLVVGPLQYIKALNGIIKKTPLDTWKTYLTWSIIHGSSEILNTSLDKENFNFFTKVLEGNEKQLPLWRRAVHFVDLAIGESVGKVYVKEHFSPEAKQHMNDLVQNLLKAYETSIKELEWMSEETKKQALDKLKKFTPKIGYPDEWRNYEKLDIVKNDLYGNMLRSTELEYNRNIERLGKPVDRKEWTMTPQTVNAYYNPSLNEIVFPAAILQPPAFDLNVDDAVNYGGIGAIIGHEIGHGFDDEGSTFDGDGVMRNWWKEQDLVQFKKRTGTLVEQYSGFKALEGLYLNGEYTLGENIGDLGGLGIALKAYKISLKDKPAPTIDGFTGAQRVFIGCSQAHLSKQRDESLRNQISSDPHSPSKFRVNGVVRNVNEFYTEFDVKPTDSLYLAPEKRVKIW